MLYLKRTIMNGDMILLVNIREWVEQKFVSVSVSFE